LYWLRNEHIEPLLQVLIAEVETAEHLKALTADQGAGRGERVKSVNRAAGKILSSMALLSGRRFGSIFIPASWDNYIQTDLENGVALAFQDVVLTAFRTELENRLGAIIAANTPPPTNAAEESRSFDTAESVPHYQAWLKYVDELKVLETNRDRYNRICSPGRGSPDDFRGLVQYLKYQAALPDDFDFDNPLFLRILKKAENRQVDNGQGPIAQAHAAKLIDGFFQNWYGPRNRIAIEVDNIAVGAEGFMRAALPYEELSSLANDIGSAADDLQNPTFEWVSQEEVPKELVSVFAGPFDTVAMFQGMNAARDVETPAAGEFVKLRAALRAKSTTLTGPILNMNATPAEVSSSVATLKENLLYMLGQTFVARAPGPPMQTAAARYLWDRASLQEAQKLFDAYDRFERGSLRSMPSYMSGVLRRVAQDRLQANVLDLIGQAQTSISTASPGDIDQELKDFTQCVDVFDPLLTGFGKLPNHTWQRTFSAMLQDQAVRMLTALNAGLDEDNPYGVKGGGFDWWDGQRPFAPAAFEVRTADDLKEYVDRTRDQLSAIADRADPLLKFLEPKLALNGSTPQAVTHLRSLIAELKRYREKRPANSVSLLEDFIQTGMDKIAPDGTCEDTVRDPVGRTDLFIVKRAMLRSKVLERCRVLSQMAYTNQIAATFNNRLAGRFPFTAPGREASAAEADPAALAEFLNKFDQYGKIATESLKRNSTSGAPRAASAFLTQMAQIRPVFSAFLAGFEKDPLPSFDFAVAFRVNPVKAIDINQVAEWGLDVGQQSYRYRGKDSTGHWRLGDPIRVTLRFADDSPMLPAADPGQPDLVVNKRTVSFEFGGMWSLFRLLLDHKANRGELDMASQKPHLLSFYIPTVPDKSLPQPKDAAAGGLVRVYVQLTVIPPGAKEGTLVPLPFPDSAPKAGEIVEP
jgi:type VI secretion system protein ImpL